MVDFPEYYEQMQGSLRAPPSAPTQTAPSQPATPPRQLTPAELRALYLDPNRSDPPVAGPPRPPAPRPAAANPQTVTPELVEDLQQFQADYRNQLTGAQPRQLSVLDMLRKRMATSMQDEQANRTADFGRALLASRSPNFFTALGEGLAAQEAGATSRMDRLRQLADTERQAAAQQAEEQYRRDQLDIERQRRDFERDPRNPRNILYSEQAGFYRAGGSGAGRGQITPARLADLTLRAEAQALRDIPEPAANSLDALRDTPAAKADREQRRRERARELLARSISTPEERAAPGTVDTAPAQNQQPGRPVIRETFVPPEARR